MLYLIESYQKVKGEWVRSLKIGHSNQFKGSRDKGYITNLGPNSVDSQVLGKRHGDIMLERMFHLKFKDKSILRESTGRYSEWYVYSEEILNSFSKESRDSMEEFLWENRKSLLDPFRKRKGRAKKVYDYLKSKFN